MLEWGVCWICTLAISVFLDSSRSIEEGIIKTTREKFVSLLQAFFIRIEFDGGSSTKGHSSLIESYFQHGIAGNNVDNDGTFLLKYLLSQFDKIGVPQMNISI